MKVNFFTKSIPFVLLWVSLCLPWVAGAQTGSVITVGDTNRKFIPYDSWSLPFLKYGPSYIQQLVLSSELNGPAIITGIDFYSSDESYWGRPGLTLYMANTYVQDMDGGFVVNVVEAVYPPLRDKKKYHVVKRGESLAEIAVENYTTVSILCKLNNFKKTVKLWPGRKIRVK